MEQETLFPYFLLVAAFFTALLVVMAIRALLRSGEGEIGGWELRGAWGRIGAVARSTLAEGIRMKIAVVFIVILGTAIPLIWIMAKGDGTIKGRVQMFIEYTLGVAFLVMSLLTVVFSCRSLSKEIARREIFGLVSKPIPRWQVIAGKWIGVTMLNVIMLAIAGAVCYGGVRVMVRQFNNSMHAELVKRGGLTEAQADKALHAINAVKGVGGMGADSPIIPAMADALGWTNQQVMDLLLLLPETMRADLRRLDQLRRQVLLARASVGPQERDFKRVAQQRYKELKEANQLPDRLDEKQVLLELEKGYLEYERAVPPMANQTWDLKGPPPDTGEDFIASVQYKFEGFTQVLPLPNGRVLEENTLLGQWCVGDPESPQAYIWPVPLMPQRLNQLDEFEIPTNVIKPDGTVKLTFANMDPRNATAVFAAKDGLAVLYRAGSFEANLFRGVVVLLFTLMFLAALGVFLSTFCTFPVAVLVALILLVCGLTSGFLHESLGLTADYFPEHPTSMDYFRKWTGETLLNAMSMGRVDVTQRLIEGRLITWGETAREFAWSVLLKGGLCLLLGVYVFRKRELAAVIV